MRFGKLPLRCPLSRFGRPCKIRHRRWQFRNSNLSYCLTCPSPRTSLQVHYTPYSAEGLDSVPWQRRKMYSHLRLAYNIHFPHIRCHLLHIDTLILPDLLSVLSYYIPGYDLRYMYQTSGDRSYLLDKACPRTNMSRS